MKTIRVSYFVSAKWKHVSSRKTTNWLRFWNGREVKVPSFVYNWAIWTVRERPRDDKDI